MNNTRDFKEDKVKAILVAHPNLRIAFKAGLLSRRLCREMLKITKWDMDDLYQDLLLAGGIRVLSSSAFRATVNTLAVIQNMDAEEESRC